MDNIIVHETQNAPDGIMEHPILTIHRGTTSFSIGLHFADKGKETLDGKLKKLIEKDAMDQC